MFVLHAVFEAPHQKGHESHNLRVLITEHSHIASMLLPLDLRIPLLLLFGCLFVINGFDASVFLDLLPRLSQLNDSEFSRLSIDFTDDRDFVFLGEILQECAVFVKRFLDGRWTSARPHNLKVKFAHLDYLLEK